MESFQSDLRHSLRILRQSPSFTIAAVAALAIGIAANAAIFYRCEYGDPSPLALCGLGSHCEHRASGRDDYLRRTLARDARELAASPFPGHDLLLHCDGQTLAPSTSSNRPAHHPDAIRSLAANTHPASPPDK